MPSLYIQNKEDLPKRHAFDYYRTEDDLAFVLMEKLLPDMLHSSAVLKMLDTGAGTGVWGKQARKLYNHISIKGIELQDKFVQPDEYDEWETGDYLLTRPTGHYDFVVGNPPYKFAEKFVRHSMENLRNGGYLLYLLRIDFLSGIDRYLHLFRDFPLSRVAICSRRPSFYENKRTGGDMYAGFLWRKGYGTVNSFETTFVVHERNSS